MEKRRRGRLKGCISPMKGMTGELSHLSHEWDLYQNGVFIGTYKGMEGIADLINKSKVRCWQMAKGYNGNRKYQRPITSRDGFTILSHGEPWGWWKED